MLDSISFDNWCQSLGFSQAARATIEQIRSSPPSRRVRSGRGNVSGNYPSRKMGVTIQFESHRNELARIYELEHDPDVLEYYDQPPSFELDYLSKSGRRNRHQYTPDFFVIRRDSAGWEECKTEDELQRLAESSPNRYQKDENGYWRCPPAEVYAHPLGLYFRLWSSTEINWVFQQNFIWLEDYFCADAPSVDESVAAAIIASVKANEGIMLLNLLQQSEDTDADVIYTLIATKQIYVDLTAERLANSDRVKVYSDRATAFAYHRAAEVAKSSPINPQQIAIAVGSTLVWDGECWEIINTGTNATALLQSGGKVIDLPNEILDKYIQEGKITALTQAEDTTKQKEIQAILQRARPDDITEANRRYEQIQPYLGLNSAPTPSSTIRRWRIQYRQAEATYGSGYIGLLPQHGAKGNRTAKMDEAVRTFMVKFIEENYETLKHRRGWRVYASLVAACEKHEPQLIPPSSKTFYAEIKKRAGVEQTEKREGRRAAIQKRSTYFELELTTPRHGDRPFEIVHIDHTELDIELISSLASLNQCNLATSDTNRFNLGRPWASFMVDAYSRRLLAVYLTYEEPSYRSCMAILRLCVQRFKRFPQSIVVDNGAEFHSNYFEQLLAYYACTKKHRPPADARFGSVVERLFGTANNQFVHELKGNTQIAQLRRKVTKSVRPSSQAEWSLGELYESLCEWAYEIYDKRQHPALGQSPHDAFNNGLAIGGHRTHRRVEYDETFCMLTLPAPDRGKRIVQPGQGIKINHIYYWSNSFRDPEIERSKVEVRYEPFDASIAYVLVKGQWVKCISSHFQYLKGRPEKEMRLIAEELRKRKRDLGRDVVLNDKELVQFLNSTEAKEGKFLNQRLQVLENQNVIQGISSSGEATPSREVSLHEAVVSPLSIGPLSLDTDQNIDKSMMENPPGSSFEEFDFYGEW